MTMVPPNPSALMEVVTLGFGVMDVVFLAIVLWEAWRRPAPVKLPPRGAV